MVSELDPTIKARMRHAENTDTRQHIRHDELDDDSRKKEKKQEDEKEPDLWEDSTTVSITALKSFFTMLLREHTPESHNLESADDKIPSVPPTSTPRAAATPPLTNQAKAAKAYQNTAHHTADPAASIAPPPDIDASNPLNAVLSPEEQRTIHQLLDDLEMLSAKGITDLTFLREGSFLNSIVSAVTRLK